MADHVFLPDQEVEWKERMSKNSSLHRFGKIVPRDSDLITDEQRAAADSGVALPVQGRSGEIHMVPRELLEPLGWQKEQLRQQGLDQALSRVLQVMDDATEAHEVAYQTAQTFTERLDEIDLLRDFGRALAGLRSVERILRLNGAN